MIDLSGGSILRTVAAVACTLLLLRTILSLNSLLHLLSSFFRCAKVQFHSYQTFNIPRSDGLQGNPLYRKAAVYVASLSGVEDSDHVNLFSSNIRPNDFTFRLPVGGIVHDSFLQSRLSWISLPGGDLALRICRKDRHRVLRPYLQHVEEVELRRKEIRLYTNTAERRWRAMPFTHPATLETVVMDPAVKSRVQADLQGFLKGRDYYARLGSVWKRSYLLYGATGTGKSTFAAAMARFLGYDVYDLDLSLVSDAGELRSLLFDTTRQSVVLVENLDHYLARPWILNAMDSVFSCCGEERVMVFTAREGNNALSDPAVKRPGRIDVLIHFPLCDFTTFKILASNYLGVQYHKLYPRVEEGFQAGERLSTAEVGEIMIAYRASPNRAIKSVINALHLSRSSATPEQMNRDGFPAGCRELGMGEAVCGLRKNATVREWRNLYGLIRLKSGIGKNDRTPAGANGAMVVPAREVTMKTRAIGLQKSSRGSPVSQELLYRQKS